MMVIGIAYNNSDKPTSMTDALGTTQFGYDSAARLTSVDGPWNNDTVIYIYIGSSIVHFCTPKSEIANVAIKV